MICPNGHQVSGVGRFCAVCGAAVAPEQRPSSGRTSSTPAWALPVAAVIGIIGVVAIVVAVILVVGGNDSDTVTAVGGSSTTAVSIASVETSAAVPRTSAQIAPPATVAPAVAPTAPPPTAPPRTSPVSTGDCPDLVKSTSGDSTADTYRRYTTSGFTVDICTANGGYWYYGADRDDPSRDIALPATATGTGYRAVRDDVVYLIDADRLVVIEGDETILDEAVISSG